MRVYMGSSLISLLALSVFGAAASTSGDTAYQQPDEVKAYMEIAIGGKHVGNLNFILRQDVVPLTVGKFLSHLPRYVGTSFHRIIPGFMVQGGDLGQNTREGADKTHVPSFPDENFVLKHVGPGIVSMANAGPNTNSSQFFITTVQTSWLDGRHVVFGKISPDSMEVLKRIEAQGNASGVVSTVVSVEASGLGHKPNLVE